MPGLLARLIKRSVALTSAFYLLDDQLAGLRLIGGNRDTDSGARHRALGLDQSLAYIEKVWRDYLAYGGRERLTGRIAEIGPGDSFGVGLLQLRYGASEVHAIDRFRSRRDSRQQMAIYRALAERHEAMALVNEDGSNEPVRGVHYHVEAAETFFRARAGQFDAIVSRAVLEHLYDPLAALDDMAQALAPGGILIHRIDFRDHGMFAGHHPLTFLTLPAALYGAMSRNSGRPNRVLMPGYRDWLARSGLKGSLRATRLAGVEGEIGPAEWAAVDPALQRQALASVADIRSRLASPFRNFADQDLAVAGVVLVAERPL